MDAERSLRRRYRWAAGWLLLNAGAHLAAHWMFYVSDARIDPARRVVVEQMRAYPIWPSWGVSLWTILCMFSLMYALLLGIFGTGQWLLARECESLALRRHAWRNFMLCGLGAAVMGVSYPVPQALMTLSVVTLLYGAAALAPHGPSRPAWPG